jgi:hypothetical protein
MDIGGTPISPSDAYETPVTAWLSRGLDDVSRRLSQIATRHSLFTWQPYVRGRTMVPVETFPQ